MPWFPNVSKPSSLPSRQRLNRGGKHAIYTNLLAKRLAKWACSPSFLVLIAGAGEGDNGFDVDDVVVFDDIDKVDWVKDGTGGVGCCGAKGLFELVSRIQLDSYQR